MKKPEGAWIFVSHSNKDIEEVREIRNHLERRGHNPLLFFLKCIEDAEELRVLLKREIEARQIFLLCDSPASRESKWVDEEQDYIRSLTGKTISTLPVGLSSAERSKVLDAISHRASYFVSFGRTNHELATKLKDQLRSLDYAVSSWDDLPLGEGFVEGMQVEILEAVESGGIILLLEARSGPWAWQETQEVLTAYENATSSTKRIYPFITGDASAFFASFDSGVQTGLDRFQLEDISELDEQAQIERILRRLGNDSEFNREDEASLPGI